MVWCPVSLVNWVKGLFDRAPHEGLLQRSRSRFGEATLLFSQKQLLQKNVWQSPAKQALSLSSSEVQELHALFQSFFLKKT